MSNRKFNLEKNTLPEISARLLSITSAKYGADWVSHPHSHYFTEIFYFKNGNGTMQIEDKTLKIEPNSLMLIGPHVQHTEFSDPKNPLDYYVLGVEGLKINTNGPIEYSIVKPSGTADSIRQCFENILRETHNKREGYDQICQHYLAILILLICRKNHVSYELVDTQNCSRQCHQAKQYLELNYSEKITLDTLAAKCNLTKYYLTHKFTELYGISPIAYLTNVRIEAAKDLLKTTNHSIEDIAIATGFSSSSYFSQAFQKACQLTPQQYRKQKNLT